MWPDPPFIEGTAWFTTVPLKALSIQVAPNETILIQFENIFFYKAGSTGSITMDHANWFRCCFSEKSDLRISTAKKHRNYKNLTIFNIENDNIVHIIDQIKIPRVQLRIGHWHLCKEGPLQLISPPNQLFRPCTYNYQVLVVGGMV